MKHWSLIERVLFAGYAIALVCGLAGMRGVSDPLLILLAAANVHVVIGRHWGVQATRRWAGLVLLAVTALLWIGAKTGEPFGSIFFTDRLGPRLVGVVPIVAPLWWYAVISAALLSVRAFWPWAGVKGEAFAVAAIVVGVDFLSEPFWMWTRGAWFWSGNRVPVQNYIAWAAVSYLLVRIVAPSHGMRYEREWRPVAILVSLLVLTALRYWTAPFTVTVNVTGLFY